MGESCAGIKPVESGIELINGSPAIGSDAYALATACCADGVSLNAPLYALPLAISPHRAAREAKVEITLDAITTWVSERERSMTMTTYALPHRANWLMVETAGGVFSPISETATNFDLARELDPAIWLLVASDSLGVLHEVTATLSTMRARGRSPDHLVLCAARTPDLSTGTNAGELELLGIARTSAVLARDDDSGVRDLAVRLLDSNGAR
jgi:dethiobiotin synthetase